jgi:tRNA pseudouridine13 synthase
LQNLPYLTADISGVGGTLKAAPEDFLVEEVPLYLPSGEGSHIYILFEKKGLPTLKAIRMVAQALNVRSKDIGYAGLKDAHAITRQTISVPDVTPEAVLALSLPGIRVLSATPHTNKLRMGHLQGNKFVIRVRDVNEDSLPLAEQILARLAAVGVPNYFGEQRFGLRENTHRLGLALLRQDPSEFLAEFLGRPHLDENPQAQAARTAFDEGRLAEALTLFPPTMREERFILRYLLEQGDEVIALKKLDKRLKRLFVSAFQSKLFNQLLAERLPRLTQLEAGDVAYLHRNGACFVVAEPSVEQARVDNFEISPAGPLFGKKYLTAEGAPGEREAALLAETGLPLSAFQLSGVRLDGGRRSYRVPLKDVSVRWDEGLVFAFELPPGAYATIVLREVMKNEASNVADEAA